MRGATVEEVPIAVRFRVNAVPPTLSGVRGDVCPETAQAGSVTRHLGQPGVPATAVLTGIGGSQAFAVTDLREVPT